jgi:hypothetical protein
MPAFEDEIQEAEAEGIEIRYLVSPRAIILEAGKVKGLECIKNRMTRAGADDRRAFVPLEDSAFFLAGDLVVAALGQFADTTGLPPEVRVTDQTVVVTDNHGCGPQEVYGGGDMTDMPRSVIHALASGNQAFSKGVKLARVQVLSAFPITPQTSVVEELAEICADDRLAAQFIRVESEHSSMACTAAASMKGVRTFTATSSHGLAYMHEMLHWASGSRLPIVMVNVSRAIGAPWSIWFDQSDCLSQRDTGWLQIYCATNQECIDTLIQAYRLAETILLPVMIISDGFILSHRVEPVDVPGMPDVFSFITGLGGMDVTPELLSRIFMQTIEASEMPARGFWVEAAS